jgi:hypothetical protein
VSQRTDALSVLQGTLTTASHGSSGIDPKTGRAWLGGQPSLAHAVQYVLADGSTRRFTKDDPEWGAVVVNLGCIGVISAITLDLVPDHDWVLTMYRNIPPQHLIEHWREMAENCGAEGQVSQIQVLGSWWGPNASMSVACRKLVPAHSEPVDTSTLEPTFFGKGELGKDAEGFYRTRTHRAHQLFGTDERQMQELQFEVRIRASCPAFAPCPARSSCQARRRSVDRADSEIGLAAARSFSCRWSMPRPQWPPRRKSPRTGTCHPSATQRGGLLRTTQTSVSSEGTSTG